METSVIINSVKSKDTNSRSAFLSSVRNSTKYSANESTVALQKKSENYQPSSSSGFGLVYNEKSKNNRMSLNKNGRKRTIEEVDLDVSVDKTVIGSKFKYLQPPQAQKSNPNEKNETSKIIPAATTSAAQKRRRPIERDLHIVTGSVSFVVNEHKKRPKLLDEPLTLLEVYGKFVGILKQFRNNSEVFVFRNFDDTGPIVQALCEKMDDIIPTSLRPEAPVRCTGRFIGQRKMQIFKIKLLENINPESLIRFENISSYWLNRRAHTLENRN